MAQPTTFLRDVSDNRGFPVPPLEPGDRLSRAEFERRYGAMPNLKKAELVEGVVYIPSPVRVYRHGQPHADLIGWMFNYRAATPHVGTGDNTTARLDLDNEPQPDAMMFIEPGFGGQIHISDEDYVESAPELVAEVASSSVSFDLNTKLHVYRRNGVREYLVWRVLDRQFDWFVLEAGEFHRQTPDQDGILKSTVFSGLWLDPAALLEGKLAQVLAVLDRGIRTPQHAAFVAKLASKA